MEGVIKLPMSIFCVMLCEPVTYDHTVSIKRREQFYPLRTIEVLDIPAKNESPVCRRTEVKHSTGISTVTHCAPGTDRQSLDLVEIFVGQLNNDVRLCVGQL